jgi:hypothetical protein
MLLYRVAPFILAVELKGCGLQELLKNWGLN